MDILTRAEAGIFRIEIHRERKKNALTGAMYQALTDALACATADAAVRVIVIAGRPGIFTAGNDLEDFMRNRGGAASAEVTGFMHSLAGTSKPVIAEVDGAAIGIGTTMLLHCDLVYASQNARFSLPFTQLGLCPEFASSLLLPLLAGYQRAAEKLLLGEVFSVQEAHAMGLVNRVLPDDALQSHVQAQAEKLCALPAPSLRITKALMKRGRAAAVTEQMAEENRHFLQMLGAAEAREAFEAFFQKRSPDFRKLE